MTATGLRAGVGRVVITPPLTAPHAGWGAQTHVLPDGVDADLWATVLVLADDAGAAAFADLDLVILSREESDAIRAAVGGVLGIPAAAVRVSVTHNHAGPPPSAWNWAGEGGEVLRGWCALLPELVAGAARLGLRDLRPARVAAGSAESRVAVNRREPAPAGRTVTGVNPGGAIDPEVFVVRLDDRDEQPLASIVGYTMHPTTMGPTNRLVSPDWPGHLKRTMETLTGAPCLFAQGATGDVGPGPDGFTDDLRVIRRLGARVACAAADAFLGLRTRPAVHRHDRVQESGAPLGLWAADPAPEEPALVRAASRWVELPVSPQPALAEAEAATAAARRRLDALRGAGAPTAEVEAATFAVKRATMTLTRAATFGGLLAFPIELHALRIGPAVLVGAECEPFVATGRAVKRRSPVAHTWFGGYTGGWYGYVPTADEIPRGGYEVDTSPFAGDAAERLETGALDLLLDLAAG